MRFTVFAALATLLLPSLAVARVVDARQGGMTIENTVTVPVDPQAAWKGLVEDVDAWWPKEHSWWGKDGKFSIEPKAGGCFCEVAGARSALHMTVGFVDPGRLMRMVGGLGPFQGMGMTGSLEWKFEPVDARATRITLTYVVGGYTTGDLSRFANVVDKVQGLQLGGLGAHLSSKK